MLNLRGIYQRSSTILLPSASVPVRDLHVTSILCGEPLKKKKKIDPALVKLQFERRRKRIEKQIRQQLKFARKLKPIDDYELHRELSKDSGPRPAEADTNTAEERLRRRRLFMEWAVYKAKQRTEIVNRFTYMIEAQEKALCELKIASPEKYDMAVKKYEELLPYSFAGPCETPPIAGYVQDGIYTDTTKSYELNPEIVKLMLDKNIKANMAAKKTNR